MPREPNSELMSIGKGTVEQGQRKPGDLLLTGEEENVQVDVRIKQNTCTSLLQSKTNQQLLNEDEKAKFGIIGKSMGSKKRYSAKPFIKKKHSKSAKRRLSPTADMCKNCNRPKSTSQSKSRSRSAGKNVRSQKLKPQSQLALKTLTMTDDVNEKDDKNDMQIKRFCPVHGLRETPTTSLKLKQPPIPKANAAGHQTPLTSYNGAAKKPHFGAAIVVHDSHRPSESQKTDSATIWSKKIRDSISFTSMTKTAFEPLNLNELNEKEQDELSEILMDELKQIASGNFELADAPITISSREPTVEVAVSEHPQLSDLPEEVPPESEKEHRINVLELGAKSVLNVEPADLAAQSNIATGLDAMSANHDQTSAFIHTELNSKNIQSVTKAIKNSRDSQGYGSEIAYQVDSQGDPKSPAQALKQKAEEEAKREPDSEEEEEYDSESYEEECEEELESEVTVDKVKPDPVEDPPGEVSSGKVSTGKLSRRTSFSSFYVIDEAEEARLKQIAFERFMADQRSKRSETINSENQKASEESQKPKKKPKEKLKNKEVHIKEEVSEANESQKSQKNDIQN